MNLTFPKFDEREIELVRQCLDSKWVTQGPMVGRFEEVFAARQQVACALATTSCTAALHMAVLALGIAPGDEVIVPAFTWITSANCVEYAGAKAVFVDIDPDTFNIDSQAIAAAITPRTKAIIVVHLFGLPVEMDSIQALADKHGLVIIEDAACSIGSEYKGKRVGGFGAIGCFSFHPRKIITTGEGGMLTTNDSDLAVRVRQLRNHGACGLPKEVADNPRPYHMGLFNVLGYNLRMSDIQAAVGVGQMEKLDSLLAERRRLAARYDELLSAIDGFQMPVVPTECLHTYQSYVIRVMEGGTRARNHIMEVLAERDIQTRPGTHAVHRLGYYAEKYGLKPERFPHAAAAEDETITIPLFPGMTLGEQELVVEVLKKSLE